MKGLPYITALAVHGEFYFTTTNLMQKLSISETAAKAIVSRLKNKNQIATPYSGFHLILPPEYYTLGCLPAEQFIPELMAYLEKSYYVGLLTAAQFYGVAHQKAQIFQVMLSDNRRSIHCGKVEVDFIARKNLEELPVRKFKTPKGYIDVATPAVTALDLVNYPLQAGGLNNVITVLAELVENINVDELMELACSINTNAQLQRLGFWLEEARQEKLAAVVETELSKREIRKVALVPKIALKKTNKINAKWKIIINEAWGNDL